MGNETTVREHASLCLSTKQNKKLKTNRQTNLPKKPLCLSFLSAVTAACARTQMPAQPVPYHRKRLRGQMQTVRW